MRFYHKFRKQILLAASLLFCTAACLYAFYYQTHKPAPVLRLSETTEAFYADENQEYPNPVSAQNPYNDLSVPTWFTKIGNDWFLVDSYHNQILYSSSLNTPLKEWSVMTGEINRGHTLAGDGIVYLADNTENNRVLIFEKKGQGFAHTQTFSNIGKRPHYCIYHEPSQTFYMWSSMTGEMYLFKREEDSSRVYLSAIKTVESLQGIYVRSFTILGDDIYFVSGNSSILQADLHTFAIEETYPVPDSLAGMAQLTKIGNYYYITVSTDKYGNQDYATMIRTTDLQSLAAGEYEDIYHYFVGGGTPYYITNQGDTWYLTEHRIPGHSLWSFQVKEDNIINVKALF